MMFKKVMIAALAAGVVFGCTAAMAAEVGTVLAAGLNFRAGPGPKYSIIGQLARGAEVTVLSRENGWLKIEFENQKGYVFHKSQFIKIAQTDEGSPEKAQNRAKDLPGDAETIQKQLKEATSEVAAISRKEKAVIEAFDTAEEALSKARKQVRQAKAGIQETEAKIDQINSASAELKKEIRVGEAYAAKRLVAMYKLNWVGRIQLLATSDSFFDFIQRRSGMERIVGQDEVVLGKLHNDQSALEALLVELNTQKAQRRALQSTLNQRINKLSAQQKKRSALLRRIRSEKTLELAALQALKKATLALDDTMKSLPPKKESAAVKAPEKSDKPFEAYKGLLSWPVKGKIISFFGPYRDEKFKVQNFQSGINIKAERGEPIRAISKGITIYASWFKGFGNMMIVDHGNHYYTVYAHLEEVFKVKGDRVEQGEVIATVGDSGSLMGPALHFEVRHHGKPMNPLKWIRKG